MAQRVLHVATDSLIDCLHMLNGLCCGLKEKHRPHRCFSMMQHVCLKSLLITLIMLNKNEMKLGHEVIATVGCELIKISVQNLNPNFNYFRKYLTPELYLISQFERYRL